MYTHGFIANTKFYSHRVKIHATCNQAKNQHLLVAQNFMPQCLLSYTTFKHQFFRKIILNKAPSRSHLADGSPDHFMSTVFSQVTRSPRTESTESNLRFVVHTKHQNRRRAIQ